MLWIASTSARGWAGRRTMAFSRGGMPTSICAVSCARSPSTEEGRFDSLALNGEGELALDLDFAAPARDTPFRTLHLEFELAFEQTSRAAERLATASAQR